MASYIDIVDDKLQRISEKRNGFFYANLFMFVTLIVYYLVFHEKAETWADGKTNAGILIFLMEVVIIFSHVKGEERICSLERELNEAQEKMKKLKVKKVKLLREKPGEIPLKERLKGMGSKMIRNLKSTMPTAVSVGIIIYWIYVFIVSIAKKDVEEVLVTLFFITFFTELWLPTYQEDFLKRRLSKAKSLLKETNPD